MRNYTEPSMLDPGWTLFSSFSVGLNVNTEKRKTLACTS